jgi:hypothetical protein
MIFRTHFDSSIPAPVIGLRNSTMILMLVNEPLYSAASEEERELIWNVVSAKVRSPRPTADAIIINLDEARYARQLVDAAMSSSATTLDIRSPHERATSIPPQRQVRQADRPVAGANRGDS